MLSRVDLLGAFAWDLGRQVSFREDHLAGREIDSCMSLQGCR